MELNPDQIALGVQQPWAELLLSGAKTAELRNVPTLVPKSIYIYASQKLSRQIDGLIAATKRGLNLAMLPRGLIIGTVEIVECRPSTPADAVDALVSPDLQRKYPFVWIIANPTRFETPLPIARRPHGIWFFPFRKPDGAESEI